MTMPTTSPRSRIWGMAKEKISQTLNQFSNDSPVMALIDLQDSGDEIRAILQFDTKTLVKAPGQAVDLVGPVVAGVRYHESFQSQAPIPWEIVTVLFPMPVYHPNVNANGGLCLGKPPANVPMSLILHLTWAALVLNTRLVTTTDWQVFNPLAAAYVRGHADRFPLTERGLLEPLPADPAGSKTPSAATSTKKETAS